MHSRRNSARSSDSPHEKKVLDSLHEEEEAEDQSIHREFIEEEIGALRRLSGEGADPSLPPVRVVIPKCSIMSFADSSWTYSGRSLDGKSTETSRLGLASSVRCIKEHGMAGQSLSRYIS